MVSEYEEIHSLDCGPWQIVFSPPNDRVDLLITQDINDVLLNVNLYVSCKFPDGRRQLLVILSDPQIKQELLLTRAPLMPNEERVTRALQHTMRPNRVLEY